MFSVDKKGWCAAKRKLETKGKEETALGIEDYPSENLLTPEALAVKPLHFDGIGLTHLDNRHNDRFAFLPLCTALGIFSE